MKTHHPNSRAERLRLREIKLEQKAKAAEKRAERLSLRIRREEALGYETDAVLKKAKKDGLTDDYEGNL